MKRILVVQLCRIGDILMTGPLLRGLRREHPQSEISLMVMDSFARAPLPLHLYDRLLTFPLGQLAGQLSHRDAGWQPAFDALHDFVAQCGSTPWDLVINLTHTDLSALLVSLMPAKKRVGLVARSDRRKGIDSGWMTYMRASTRSRELGCFHLVDLFSWTAGVARDHQGLELAMSQDDHDWADRYLAAHQLTGRPLIAMQLGASTVAKQWPVERFAALANALPAALGDVVVIGGPSERALAATFLNAATRQVFDSTGESSLGQLGALLQRCRLLITNDTGPMHIATAVGTRVIDISSGPVSPYETGPYGEGHLVVEPDLACSPCALDTDCQHFACRTALSIDDAVAVARFALGDAEAPTLHGARLLVSRRTAASGRLEFVPATSPLRLRDRVRFAAADVWEQTLRAPGRVGADWPIHSNPACDAHDDLDVSALESVRAQLRIVAHEADIASAELRALPKASPAKVPALAEAIHARLERLLAVGETERAAHAIVTQLRHEIDSVHAADLAGMARAQGMAYAAASQRARLLAEKLAG